MRSIIHTAQAPEAIGPYSQGGILGLGARVWGIEPFYAK